MPTVAEPGQAVARRKHSNQSKDNASPPARDRIDLRADPAWVARVERQAERLGITLTAYVKAAVSRALEADEATDPRNL